MLTACTDTTLTGEIVDTNEISANMELSAPDIILSARAVNLDALFAEVEINGETERFEQGSTITTTFSIVEGDRLDISIKWYQSGDVDELLLATWSSTRTITANIDISVNASDYDTEGDSFDRDGDGHTNLTELRADSDPFDPEITPVNLPNVRIRRINPEQAPDIDGIYNNINNNINIWDSAEFDDVQGELLYIDNLIINEGAIRPDGDTEFRWFALHDDTFLYVFVLGESANIATPFRDSTAVWQDDSVSLFIDGNNSKLDSYDGFDDRQILVPLLTDATNPSSNDSVFARGTNSAPLPEFEFATCLCSEGQHTWEFRLPLTDFNITRGVPFGFEVLIDEDNDGGARDAQWAWFLTRDNAVTEPDKTWRIPSSMGIAILE